MKNNKQLVKIGALWKRTSANGNEFFTGTVTVDGKLQNIIAFTNKQKTSHNHPDWTVYESEPPTYQGDKSSKPTKAKTEKVTAPAEAPVADEVPL